MSGERTEDSDRDAGLLVGADDYLAKPFVVGRRVTDSFDALTDAVINIKIMPTRSMSAG